MPADNKIRIGLLWHSVRSGNLGVGALTVGNIVLLREACAELGLVPSFVIMGGREDGAAYVQGDDIEARDIDRNFLLSRSEYWRLLDSLDCLVDIGGGDSFSDIYGLFSLGLLSLPKNLALLRRKPLLLSPQTIGPFDRLPSRRLAAYIMNRADAVLARDPTSYEVARRVAKRGRTSLSVDVAFKLPFERRARSTDSAFEVGVNVSGLLFNQGQKGADSFGLEVDYPRLMRHLLGKLTARDDVAVKLITHVVSPRYDDDGRVADTLAAEFPGVERVPNFGSPSEAKSYISGLDFLIAGRMHACIAAFSTGVPVIPIAYSRKFAGLFEGVLDYRHGVPVKGLSTEQALAYLLSALDRGDEFRRDVQAGLARVDVKLDVYRAELKRFLSHAAARKAA